MAYVRPINWENRPVLDTKVTAERLNTMQDSLYDQSTEYTDTKTATKVDQSSVGISGGVASLGSNGLVPDSQLPPNNSSSLLTALSEGEALSVDSSGEAIGIQVPTVVLPGQTPTGVGVEMIFTVNGLDNITINGINA